MGRIFIIRHGAVENPSDLLYSRLPGYHLNELGRSQAREAGSFMSKIPLDVIIASSLERAQETAQIITGLNPNHPAIVTDDRVTDADFGEYTGAISVKEFDNHREHYWQLQLAGQDGMESPQAIADRMYVALTELAERYRDKNILIVSHGDPIAFLLETIQGQALTPAAEVNYPKKASIFEIDLAAGQTHNIFTPVGSQF